MGILKNLFYKISPKSSGLAKYHNRKDITILSYTIYNTIIYYNIKAIFFKIFRFIRYTVNRINSFIHLKSFKKESKLYNVKNKIKISKFTLMLIPS